MKKAKILLASIAVLAVVGGALAFKATKVIPSTAYCTGNVINVCPNGLITTKAFAPATPFVYYTPTSNTLLCNLAPVCTSTGTTGLVQ